MELDELKKYYLLYDKKLDVNLKFNEELLKKMNFDSSRKEIQKPYIYEIINLILCFFIFSYFIGSAFQVLNEIQYSLSGFLSAFIILIYLILAIIKINKFSKIDYYNNSVIKLQRDLTQLKTIILRTRKIELIILPIVIFTMFPILFKVVYNVNIYLNTSLFISMVIIFLCISFIIAIWINRHIYDRKLRNAIDFLDELNKFENEEFC